MGDAGDPGVQGLSGSPGAVGFTGLIGMYHVPSCQYVALMHCDITNCRVIHICMMKNIFL